MYSICSYESLFGKIHFSHLFFLISFYMSVFFCCTHSSFHSIYCYVTSFYPYSLFYFILIILRLIYPFLFFSLMCFVVFSYQRCRCSQFSSLNSRYFVIPFMVLRFIRWSVSFPNSISTSISVFLPQTSTSILYN